MSRSVYPRWYCDGLPREAQPPTCRDRQAAGPCPGHKPSARIHSAAKVLAWADGTDDLYAVHPIFGSGPVEDYLSSAAEALHATGQAL